MNKINRNKRKRANLNKEKENDGGLGVGIENDVGELSVFKSIIYN
jgi:hypothetical protein